MAYRILSIDGGGIHGYSSVILLKRLFEEQPNFLDKVDLVTGTSIGGILALGLAHGHDINKVEQHFLEGIPYAFNTNWFRTLMFYAGVCPKYDNTPFKRFLLHLFGKVKLGELNKKVVITSFSLNDEDKVNKRWRAKIFHNFEGTDSDGECRVVDVAMATSSAPVFFQTYNQYVDGATISNNPSLIALTQTQDRRAIIENRPKLEDIKILSLGTIRDVYVDVKNAQWGYFCWARHLVQLISEKDVMVTNYQCDKLIGPNYHRMETVVNGPMDEFDHTTYIKKVAMDYPLDNTFKWLKENWYD